VRIRILCVVAALLIAAPGLFADGTIRYESKATFGPLLTAAAAKSNPPMNLALAVPTPSRTTHVKNGKWEQDGGTFTGIFDVKTMQITLIDPEHKIFATGSLEDMVSQLLAQMPAQQNLPPQAQMILQSMTTTFASQKTGRTGMVLGLQTEETEMTLSLNMAVPASLWPMMSGLMAQSGEPVTLLKIVMRMWNPTQAEAERFPALTQLRSPWPDQSTASARFAGVSAVAQKFLAKYPGLAAGLTAMIAETMKNKTVMLKYEADVYAPVLTQLAPILKARGIQDVDATVPLLGLGSEAVEVSGAPIADSVFEVPADYHATTLMELLQGGRPPARGGKPGMPTPHGPGDAQGLGRLP
jgi:hypothetical protein